MPLPAECVSLSPEASDRLMVLPYPSISHPALSLCGAGTHQINTNKQTLGCRSLGWAREFVAPPPVSSRSPSCCWTYGHGGWVGVDREVGKPRLLRNTLHEEHPYLQGPLLAKPPVSVLTALTLLGPAGGCGPLSLPARPEPNPRSIWLWLAAAHHDLVPSSPNVAEVPGQGLGAWPWFPSVALFLASPPPRLHCHSS